MTNDKRLFTIIAYHAAELAQSASVAYWTADIENKAIVELQTKIIKERITAIVAAISELQQ